MQRHADLHLVDLDEEGTSDSLVEARADLWASLFEHREECNQTTHHLVRVLRAADREASSPVLRRLLALAALQLIFAAVLGFAADDALRQPAVFVIAYAAGLCAVVARPAKARTMLGVAVVLVAAELTTIGAGVVTGRSADHSVVPLILEIGSAWLLWMLTRTDLRSSSVAERPALRLVVERGRRA